jgi:putative acetyltransferase
MSLKFTLRDETPADLGAITEVTMAAFETLAISQQTEQFIVAALRAAGALSVSLVAESGDRVISHVAFSPVTLSDGTPDCYGLGPVSVLPALQRQGVGRALIQEGLAQVESPGRARLLSGGASGLLPAVRLQEYTGIGAGGRAAGGLFCVVV